MKRFFCFMKVSTFCTSSKGQCMLDTCSQELVWFVHSRAYTQSPNETLTGVDRQMLPLLYLHTIQPCLLLSGCFTSLIVSSSVIIRRRQHLYFVLRSPGTSLRLALNWAPPYLARHRPYQSLSAVQRRKTSATLYKWIGHHQRTILSICAFV